MREEWRGFKEGKWCDTINVSNFIKLNFTPFLGDGSFLEGPTENTLKLWDQVMDLTQKEKEAGGVLDMDTDIVSTVSSHGAGYLNKDLETIVG
ncbi:MAG: formate acetyltransferase, partial [Candidatus Delongbacteria bacterium]